MRSANLVTGFTALLVLTACGGGGQPEFPPPEVSVAQVVQKRVQLSDEFSGRIEAIDRVELRPRVSGYLSTVHFREGSSVERGQILFSIDDREYLAAVDSASANLARAQSRLDLANTEYKRSERLIAERAISQGELDQREGELLQAQADIGAMQAALVTAELNLSFTEITAPLDGKISSALVKPGNLVAAGESLLSTIVTIDPVYVTFSVDEQVYLKYQGAAVDAEDDGLKDMALQVEVGLSNESGYPHSGEIVFFDNALSSSTGTILVKAELDNSNGVFIPGLYARVRVIASAEEEVMLINEVAVLNDLDRKFVYVLGENNSTMRKDVKLGSTAEGLRVVENGLSAEDVVVVSGVQKIFYPGAPVQPKMVPMNDPEQAQPLSTPPVAQTTNQ